MSARFASQTLCQAETVAGKAAINRRLDKVMIAAFAPTCDCSGCAADAVRNRALSPSSAAKAAPGIPRPGLRRRASLFRGLTQTRWDARSMDCQFRCATGPGDAVLSRTTAELPQNHYAFEIARFVVRFSRFYAGASRDVRVGTRVGPRTSEGGQIYRTTRTTNLIYINHKVNGSSVVLARFCPEPAQAASIESGGLPRFADILPGGIVTLDARCWLRDAGPIFQTGPSPVMRGRVTQSFGFAPPAGFAQPAGVGLGVGGTAYRRRGALAGGLLEVVQGADIALRTLGGSNGEFPPFSRAAAGDVGRVMLEGMAQSRRKARILSRLPLPVRLGHMASAARLVRASGHGQGGLDRPGHPPLAPIGAAFLSSSLAEALRRIWNGFPPMRAIPAGAQRGRARQMWAGRIGSGMGVCLPALSGGGRRLVRAGDPGTGPRRSAHASEGIGHVN